MIEKVQRGFTLIELIAVMVIVGVMSMTLFSRLGSLKSTQVQASRDDLIAALFFAQQTAMARSGVQLVVTASAVTVTENLPPATNLPGYPLPFAQGVSAIPKTFSYDKLGRTTAGTINLTGSSGVSAVINVEASGYVH
jgi:MSHA pilin protein MshC